MPHLKKTSGKLAVLTPGMGAVATTFYAGTMAARRDKTHPIGSLTQLGKITDANGTQVAIRDFADLCSLDDLVFGGWDPYKKSAYQQAVDARVLDAADLLPLERELSEIVPMSAVFSPEWVTNLEGLDNVKPETSKWELAQAVRGDIRDFCAAHGADRAIMVWCASTEAYRPFTATHATLRSFEDGLRASSPDISPSQIYVYAALMEHVPFANGAPNLSAEAPALYELAMEQRIPLCGKDFKTGQTLMKTIIAPGLAKRYLGVQGWFSTNILGNRDGLVLDDPDCFRSKEVTKLGVLESLLSAEEYPELYGDLYHKVRINYYPPRGDAKEGWDAIDIKGWMGYPMHVKINFECRDSILAAPLVLDMTLLLDLAQRRQARGVQEWMSLFFKSPMTAPTGAPQNNLFSQYEALEHQLREWAKPQS